MRTQARNRIGRSDTRRGIASVALALAFVATSAEAAGSSVPPQLRACASEKDDARRLACFDREIAAADGGAEASRAERSAPIATASAAPPATPAPQATPSTPEEKFGYRGQIARKELDEKAAADNGGDRMEATVVAVTNRPRGELVLTLDNGQVWAQKTAEPARVKVGERIAIKKASFGSFLLVLPNNRTTRVTREK